MPADPSTYARLFEAALDLGPDEKAEKRRRKGRRGDAAPRTHPRDVQEAMRKEMDRKNDEKAQANTARSASSSRSTTRWPRPREPGSDTRRGSIHRRPTPAAPIPMFGWASGERA